jgi:hypothetical protein
VNWWTRELAGLIEANNSRDRLTRGTLLPVKALVHVKHEQISEPKSARIDESGLAQVRHGGVDFGHFRAWPEQK